MTDYSKNKYQMGIDLQTTKNHPGYSAEISAEANVRRGLAYRNQTHRTVAKQLQQLANITHKKVFQEAADLARARAHEKGQYKEDAYA